MWELNVVYANANRQRDTFTFDEKPQVDTRDGKMLLHSGTLDGREQEVWLHLDNVAAWWMLGPSQR
jgi:hypothetical protein